ncbi:hypothetical protein D3C78_1816190 [compost metagenome]
MSVAEVAPDNAAQRAYQERQREYREGSQQAGGLVSLREEGGGDDGGQIAVGGVVEPLDEVAHEAGPGGLAQRLAFGVVRGAGDGGWV